MVREVIWGNIARKLLALSLIVLISATISPLSYAEQVNETSGALDESTYIEIEVLPDLAEESDQREFIYAKSTVADYQAGSVDSRDILRSMPSIITANNKTMGLVIPPFAYFKTKF